MEEETTNAIVQGANDPLGLAVLRRSVWARETQLETVSSEMRAYSLIIKLFAIDSLKSK